MAGRVVLLPVLVPAVLLLLAECPFSATTIAATFTAHAVHHSKWDINPFDSAASPLDPHRSLADELPFLCSADVNRSSCLGDLNTTWIDHCHIIAVKTNTSSEGDILNYCTYIMSTLSIIGGVWTIITCLVVPEARNAQILVEVRLREASAVANVCLCVLVWGWGGGGG